MPSHCVTGFLAAAALAVSSVALAQSQPAVTPGGASTPGELREGDAVLEDGRFYRCHRLAAQPGQVARIVMASTDFDAFLVVGKGPSCQAMTDFKADDDSGGGPEGLDAQVTVAVDDDGPWWVRASGNYRTQVGAYALHTELIPAVLGHEVRRTHGGRDVIQMGQIVADRLTDESPQSADGIYFRCHTFVAEGPMVTEILLNSADFDSYLTVKAGGCPGGRVVAENDDFDDTLDSRIRRRLAPGPYAIVVSTVDGYATGDYLLTLSIGGIED